MKKMDSARPWVKVTKSDNGRCVEVWKDVGENILD
jgi:hypothetical protein